MFSNKTVASIVAPISNISANLRNHVTAQVKQIENHNVVIANLGSMVMVCEGEFRAANRLADKLEALLSVDDDTSE